MRLFVAVYPPDHVLDDLQSTVERLHIASGPRLNDRVLWHITLAFLGQVADDAAKDVCRAMERAAEVSKPSTVRLAGGGQFGRVRSTLVYAGVGGDVASLERIATTVRRELRAIDVTYDERRFNPHLTLARPGTRVPEPLIALDLATLALYRGPQWTIRELFLVASHDGPVRRYEPIHRAEILAGGR